MHVPGMYLLLLMEDLTYVVLVIYNRIHRVVVSVCTDEGLRYPEVGQLYSLLF